MPKRKGHNPTKPSTPDARTKEKHIRISTACISPGRKVGICSEYIDQLSKLHTLLKSGAITKEHCYDPQCTVALI